MRKALLPLTILCFFIFVGQGGASIGTIDHYYNYYPNGLANATGIVTATGLNSIAIDDEDQKKVERFVYLDQREEFHKGDYIRIYYYPQGAIVAAIKRMTVLEYKNTGQNLGNVYHKTSN